MRRDGSFLHIFWSDFSLNSRRISKRKAMGWNVFRHDASRADHATFSDRHAR